MKAEWHFVHLVVVLVLLWWTEKGSKNNREGFSLNRQKKTGERTHKDKQHMEREQPQSDKAAAMKSAEGPDAKALGLNVPSPPSSWIRRYTRDGGVSFLSNNASIYRDA